MKLRALFWVAALVTGLRGAGAANDPYRDIEVAELHRTLTPALVAALDSAPLVAGRAALAIGRTKRPEGAGPLRAHLQVTDAGERALVVYGWGLLGDAVALEAVREVARHDPNSAVRYAAVDALGRITLARPAAASRETGVCVLAVARRDADPVVRAHAAAQLDAFGRAAFAPELVRGLQDGVVSDAVPDVRAHAAWAIFRGYAKLADPGFLRRALHARDELVRVAVLRAWGRRSDPGAAAFVRPLLADPSWRVQLEAAETLKRLAKTPPTEHLTAVPAGVHLPALPAAPRAGAPASPEPAESPAAAPVATGTATATADPAAPNPETLPLATSVGLPQSARAMNGPLAGPHPRVAIGTTKGEVVVRLYPEWAPSTVANFLALTERGFFDGNRWFRIVPDFVVQTGDRNDDGVSEPGFSIPAEENPLEQRTGIIAMGLDYAGSHPKRDSAATQFYMTLSPQYHLDRDFTVFGEVESGFAVLANLLERDRMTVVRRIADG